MYKSARLTRIKRQRRLRNVLRFTIVLILLGLATSWFRSNYEVRVQSPILIEEVKLISPVPSETPEVATRGAQINHIPDVGKMVVTEVRAIEGSSTTIPTKHDLNQLEGEASYYSRAGCLGCSESMTMANGEILDDSKLTLALTPEMVRTHKLLNDTVVVENVSNGKTVRARVTDTGGFGRYNRVADLSVATRDAIGCKNLCQVKITY